MHIINQPNGIIGSCVLMLLILIIYTIDQFVLSVFQIYSALESRHIHSVKSEDVQDTLDVVCSF